MCNYLTIDFSLSPNFPCFFLIESDPTFFKRHIVRENSSNLRVRIESETPSAPLHADNNQQFLEFKMILHIAFKGSQKIPMFACFTDFVMTFK